MAKQATLGMVATGRRNISSGKEYDKYFNYSDLEGSDPIILQDGDSYATLREMEKIARKYSYQTKKISQVLKGKTVKETLKNIYNFLYKHVQYKKDSPTEEQLRTPLRTWKDRKTGVDCDCFSIFISSVLINLGIAHTFRMAGYKSDFQHVYSVVLVDSDTALNGLESSPMMYWGIGVGVFLLTGLCVWHFRKKKKKNKIRK